MPLPRSFATKFFGEMVCSEEELLEFPLGLPGFETRHWFVLMDQPATRPLVFLQSIEDQGLCFAALPLQQLDSTLRVQVTREEAGELGVSEADGETPAQDFLQLALVSLEEDEPTANLLAPVVIHVPARRGLQVIQWESGRSPREPIRPFWEGATCS